MARPPKTSGVPHELHQAIHERYLSMAREAGVVHMPSPDYQEKVILALLQRLRKMDQALAAHCAGEIAVIAGAEKALFAPPERVDAEIKRALNSVAFGKPSRATCIPETVYVQRDMLLNFLTREGYPRDARNDETRKEWLSNRWQRIIDVISPDLCFCNYTVSFEGLLRLAKQQDRCHPLDSIPATADLILANLHNTTPANIGRLLKTIRS